jgi:hypothetical protein
MSEWLASLVKLKQWVPDDLLVLPAHNEPFRCLHARLDHLLHSQQRALDRLRGALAQPKRVVDVFSHLFARPIGSDPQLLNMATGESVAHLNFLLQRDEAIREIATDGVAWYRLK